MSNIEDIKILERMIEEYENCSVPEVDMQVDITFREKQAKAINNILLERKQDKQRIKELEEALLKVKDKNTTLFIACRNSIPKQKVKNILQKNRNELFSITYLEPKQYEPYEKQIERINKIETELLEGE